MAETLERAGLEDAATEIPARNQRLQRIEIDTTAPFESVREAVTRFGGLGYWKPSLHKFHEAELDAEERDITKVEEQAVELEKQLILKERETFEVLKELEATKKTVEELRSRLEKEASEVDDAVKVGVDTALEEEKENCVTTQQNLMNHFNLSSDTAPGKILMKLKQAKLYLSGTTYDLADIRASVELLNKNIEKERTCLEKTRERVALKSATISSLEEELDRTRIKLKLVKGTEIQDGSTKSSELSRELHRLNSEAEQFKKMGESARLVVRRAISEVERTRNKIKTMDIKLIAAQKMKEAARAAETVAFAEIRALSNSCSPSPSPESVTMSCKEYSSLAHIAKEAEELANVRVVNAMRQVDEANMSKTKILRQVGEAVEEVKASKRALEEALRRVEAANDAKLEVEEALRNWRSENGQKRRSVHNTARFKNPCLPQHRRDSHLLDVNGITLVKDESSPVLKPTLSIGQILSRKLLLAEESDTEIVQEKASAKRKISLGQMLGKTKLDTNLKKKFEKENRISITGKRKKFVLARFPLLLSKQNKRKKSTLNMR